MKSEIVLNLRQFPVLAHDHRDGQEKHIIVTVTKDQLRAAGLVGQSSKELMRRCWRCGREAEAYISARGTGAGRRGTGGTPGPLARG